MHFIVTYQTVGAFEKGDSSNLRKMKGYSFQQVLQQKLSCFLCILSPFLGLRFKSELNFM